MTDEYPQYRIYVGENIGNTSFWMRTDETTEKPIMANTRGLTTWFSYKFDEYENTEPNELSNLCIEWLAHIYRARNGLYDSGALPAIKDNEPDEEPVWYETEILNALNNPKTTTEQQELLEWAYEKDQ